MTTALGNPKTYLCMYMYLMLPNTVSKLNQNSVHPLHVCLCTLVVMFRQFRLLPPGKIHDVHVIQSLNFLINRLSCHSSLSYSFMLFEIGHYPQESHPGERRRRRRRKRRRGDCPNTILPCPNHVGCVCTCESNDD